ncbi:ribosome biogenesis GTPase Der [Patescibacteria group bacterium]|nr:ribosome biogenesis GTPase Der [Patescibacteria group bacterium]
MIKIALIGQVNVGKSTFFNRLISEPKAIISKIPGTTRDRNYGLCQWQGQNLTFIDTGGLDLEKKSSGEIEKQTRKQIIKAIEETDLVFFLIEIRPAPPSSGPPSGGPPSSGPPISNFEREVSRIIKKSKKPCFLILNKADNPKKRDWAKSQTWLKLGFGQPFAISAANGSGIGDLLDEVIKKLAENRSPQIDKTGVQRAGVPLKVAIVGKPNVGKSTLLNTLLGEEKVIVSSLPHTTRGPQDTLIYHQNQPLLLIDTAGIRRKSKIKLGIEQIGVKKSLRVIQKSDLVLMVLDVTQEISHQDKALLSLIIKNKKGLILVVNKCDLAPSVSLPVSFGNKGRKKKTTGSHSVGGFVGGMAQWAPIIFISAKTGENVKKIFNLIQEVEKNRCRWIKNKELTDFLEQIILGKKFNQKIWAKIKIEQIDIRPPKFVLKTSKSIIKKKVVPQAQINIIEKEIRKKWPFKGTPIIIKLGT